MNLFCTWHNASRALSRLMCPVTQNFDRFDAQERALEKFRLFATQNNVHLSLVRIPSVEAYYTDPQYDWSYMDMHQNMI